MIIKYDSQGNIISTVEEAFVLPEGIGFVQVIEDGEAKFQDGEIHTASLDGEIALNYQDPLKHEYKIHKCKISFQGDKGFIEDKKNNRRWHFKKGNDKINHFVAKEILRK